MVGWLVSWAGSEWDSMNSHLHFLNPASLLNVHVNSRELLRREFASNLGLLYSRLVVLDRDICLSKVFFCVKVVSFWPFITVDTPGSGQKRSNELPTYQAFLISFFDFRSRCVGWKYYPIEMKFATLNIVPG